MKKLFQIGLLLLLATTAVAQESSPKPPKILRTFDWKDLSLPSTNYQIVSMDGVSVLKIENTNGQPLEFTLLQITNPSVIKKASSLSCDMKYEDVGFRMVERAMPMPLGSSSPGFPYRTAASGSLKLLQQFPPDALGGDERTNESSFPFEGTSNWKPFRFDVVHMSIERGVNGSFDSVPERLPRKLKMTLILPTNGIVYLRPIKLLEPVGESNWWSQQQAGAIGGIGGAIIGCLGGLIGILGSKGKARNFVLATIKIFIALGIILLIAGVVAIALQQPYEVWYSLLLPGFILTLVFSLNLPSIQRRYDELEIRRMTSIDTMRS